MKKLAITLSMLYALLVAFASKAENITVSGTVANTGGAPVEVHFTDGDTIVNMSVLTGPLGQYTVVVTTDDSVGVLIIYFFNCDSALVDTIIPYYTGMPPVTFNADYCDSLGTSVCLSELNIVLDSLTNVYTITIDSTVQQNTVSYLWDFGNGDTSIDQLPVYTYPQTGTYDVCLTVTEIDGQICMSCNAITIDSPGFTLDIVPYAFVGVASIGKADDVRVYPNPTADLVTLRFPSPYASSATLRVVNTTGATVKIFSAELRTGTNALVVDMNELPSGLYTIAITNGTRCASSRVVKL